MVNADDVITYVGIPLAVLGVLPIFYTCIRSTLALRSIRHTLKANGLSRTAITRGSLMTGIVEVEIPRRRITPLDRSLDAAYWKLNLHTISLPGGTWAIFPWNEILTGRTLYRCQYSEELRVPPAEIHFEELVAFLLDRGAVPDAKGWKVLKSIGLWTPTGTVLLRAPCGDGEVGAAVLKLAPPYDGDGILRLAVHWESRWDRRDVNSLPPFWMRLERPIGGGGGGGEDSIPTLFTQIEEMSGWYALESESESELVSSDKGSANDGIRFHAKEDYVESVQFERGGLLTGKEHTLTTDSNIPQWFTWASCALSQKRDSGLWNVSIPSHIATFATKTSIPGGVLVLLQLVGESDIPPFAEPPPDRAVDMAQKRHQQFLESVRQRTLESKMPPAQADEARRQRQISEAQAFHTENMQAIRARKEYEERRVIAALNSQPMAIPVVAEKGRLYLIAKKVIPAEYGLEDLVRAVLYLMVFDGETARVVTEILERWLSWSQQSGINPQQLEFLKGHPALFCYAAALLAVVEGVCRGDSQSSSDIMECLKIWHTVHLG